MSITGTSFLFLFLPACVIIYHLLLRRAPVSVKNGFLLAASLGFYAWGEPIRILILLALIAATWILGNACAGHPKSKKGRFYVTLCVLMNVGALFVYKYLDFVLANLGYVTGHEFSLLGLTIPLGLSYFCFSSISYVVDLYRGRSKPQNLLNTALFLSLFFKITAGPIVKYGQFENQLKERTTTAEQFAEGAWRFVIGFCKKMIFSVNLFYVVESAFGQNYQAISVSLAWLGALAYMLQLYFDFSGYTDMAIGLGKMFGFNTPENFDYPYASTSVAEYWRRWHMTLGEWFREYMYYPITLGPAIKWRKWLMKRFSRNTSKFIQNLMILTIVWATTGLWHGARWNYLLWGLLNGWVVFFEMYKKPMKNRKLEMSIGWLYTFMLSLMTKPLAYTANLREAAEYYGAMLGMHGNVFACEYSGFLTKEYSFFLIAGLICAFPFGKWLMSRITASENKGLIFLARSIVIAGIAAAALLSVAYSIRSNTAMFIYGNF